MWRWITWAEFASSIGDAEHLNEICGGMKMNSVRTVDWKCARDLDLSEAVAEVDRVGGCLLQPRLHVPRLSRARHRDRVSECERARERETERVSVRGRKRGREREREGERDRVS